VQQQPESLNRVRELTGLDFPFIEGDIRDRAALDKLFRDHDIDAVIHFAGLKAVGESVAKPLIYYDNNIAGSVTLFEAMQAAGVKTVVFSSSATVYGDPASVPIREDFPVGATTNPYGTSKLFIEKILQDVAISPTRPGISPCCAISTRWAPTRAAASAKTRAASPTT
jgi:UDP-glucose 4-epimerase